MSFSGLQSSMNFESSSLNPGGLDIFVPSQSLEKRFLKELLDSHISWRKDLGPMNFPPYGFPEDLKKPHTSTKPTVLKALVLSSKRGGAPLPRPCLAPTEKPALPVRVAESAQGTFTMMDRKGKKLAAKPLTMCSRDETLSPQSDPFIAGVTIPPLEIGAVNGFEKYFSSKVKRTEQTCPVYTVASCTQHKKGFKIDPKKDH
jgi:hypothetical protein